MYRCLKCKKEIENIDQPRCPYCGYRIVAKARPTFVKRVKAE